MAGKYLILFSKKTHLIDTSFGRNIILKSFHSLNETDWSVQMANDITSLDWQCKECKNIFNISGIERLQHQKGNVFLCYFI